MSPISKSEEKGSSSSRKRKPSGSSSTSTGASSTTSAAKKVATSPASTPKKLTPMIIDFGQLEEKQALERPAEKDSAAFKATCTKLKEILTKIHEIKQASGPNAGRKSSEALTELKNDFLMSLLTLKKLNRLDKLRTKNCREGTIAAKSKVDSFHLQLQNLLYEVLHLQKEVTKCLQYKSADDAMDLVPLEEFFENAPSEISDKEKTEGNEHLLRLARLEYENLQRQKQREELKKLEETKAGLDSHIQKKRENLANLKPQLAAILEASKPVQKFLNMPLSDEHDQRELSQFLPGPLFVLFSETRAYGQACDPDLTVRIEGDLEEAKAEFSSNLRKRLATTGDSAQDEEEEEAKDEDEEDDSKKKKKKSGASKIISGEEKLKKMLDAHPLKVELKIKLKQSDNFVHLVFSHLTELEVVCVKVKLILDQECKSFSGERDVMQPQNLLAHLLSNDDEGEECPNPGFNYVLKKAGLDPKSLSTKSIGSMYAWAQNLSGLNFVPKSNMDEKYAVNAEASVSQPLVEKTIEAIKERLVSRIFLQREISQLEKSKLINVDLDIPERLRCHFPSKISSTIRAWTSVNWEQYVALDVTKHLVESKAVTENHFLFRLQINRGEHASLIALIAVKPDHPFSPPVFCLNLHWNGEHNTHNSENIRALEKAINYGFVDLLDDGKSHDKYCMLGLQIKRLMGCYDVLLEAWQMQGTDIKVNFAREKMFLHSVR